MFDQLSVMAHCSVPLCANNWRKRQQFLEENGKKLSFHEFPKDPALIKEWIVKIRPDRSKNFEVSGVDMSGN